MSTYRELLQAAYNMLEQANIADARIDAWYLLAYVFNIKRADYLLHQEEEAPVTEALQYLSLVKERAGNIPLQHLTGSQEFMGLEFEVNEHVLIPRQDTELLVEEVLKVCKGKDVLDMCTGSGCIIISLAKLGDISRGVAVDISKEALDVAAKNAIKHNVNIEYIKSDLFEKVKGSFHVIVSNPPYIPTEDIKNLMPEVKLHEPMLALDGSRDGLDFYRRIAKEAKNYLKKDSYIFFEIGYNQGEDVKQILRKEGFTDIYIKQDLSGLDRVVVGRWISPT